MIAGLCDESGNDGSAMIALLQRVKSASVTVVGKRIADIDQGLLVFLGVEKSDDVKNEIIARVKHDIGPIAKPDKIQFADGLPKTRSGKIMRRILKAIAQGKEDVGTTTTLADPSVVDVLKAERL